MHQDDVSLSEKAVSLVDLLDLLKRNMSWIAFWCLVGALVGGYFCLTRPRSFQAEATFLEQSDVGVGSGGMSGLMGMLMVAMAVLIKKIRWPSLNQSAYGLPLRSVINYKAVYKRFRTHVQ